MDRLLNFAEVVRKGGISAVTGGERSRDALLSKQIAGLASHFEVELTRRTGRGISITPAGAELARVVNEFEAGLEDLRSQVRSAPVNYSIAASNSVLHWLFLPQMKAISSSAPNVKWTLHHETSDGILEKVSMGQIDFGICVGPVEPKTLKRRLLGTVEYSLFVPAALGKPKDSAAALRTLPLALPVGGALRRAISAWAKKEAVALNVRLDLDSYLLAASTVINGTHAAALPSLARGAIPPSAVVLSLPTDVALRRKVWLVWTNRTLHTRAGASAVRNVLAESLGIGL